jgi:hypothetical protein
MADIHEIERGEKKCCIISCLINYYLKYLQLNRLSHPLSFGQTRVSAVLQQSGLVGLRHETQHDSIWPQPNLLKEILALMTIIGSYKKKIRKFDR